MRSGVLLDTGPLVAFLYGRDAYHDWAVETFAGFDFGHYLRGSNDRGMFPHRAKRSAGNAGCSIMFHTSTFALDCR